MQMSRQHLGVSHSRIKLGIAEAVFALHTNVGHLFGAKYGQVAQCHHG